MTTTVESTLRSVGPARPAVADAAALDAELDEQLSTARSVRSDPAATQRVDGAGAQLPLAAALCSAEREITTTLNASTGGLTSTIATLRPEPAVARAAGTEPPATTTQQSGEE